VFDVGTVVDAGMAAVIAGICVAPVEVDADVGCGAPDAVGNSVATWVEAGIGVAIMMIGAEVGAVMPGTAQLASGMAINSRRASTRTTRMRISSWPGGRFI
jgi:hypothetical protein